MLSPKHFVGAGSLLCGALFACGSSTTDDTDQSLADLTNRSRCVVKDKGTGKSLSVAELTSHNDPIATILLTTAGCPQTVSEITTKLRKNDTQGCADKGPGKAAEGVSTYFVSEEAATSGSAQGAYRTVSVRKCAGRPEQGLFISALASPKGGVQEDFAELIGQDPNTKEFHFYTMTREGKDAVPSWTSFGSSSDMIDKGYTCRDGGCVAKAEPQLRCAGCHAGGGLVMKETKDPNVFWHGRNDEFPKGPVLPGAEDLATRFPAVYGDVDAAPGLQGSTTDGNTEWVARRADFLKAKGAQELLRPLFCTVEVNLETSPESAARFASFGSAVLVDPSLAEATLSGFSAKAYTGLLSGRDAPSAMISPVRSSQDLLYQGALVKKGLIDEDLLLDILNIDFTRPIFSPSRCALLDSVPSTLRGDAITPNAIRSALVKQLGSSQTADAKQLLLNLQTPGDAAAHKQEARQFLTACKKAAKDAPEQFLGDVLSVVAHVRERSKSFSPIIENKSLMLPLTHAATTKALDPKTCKLGN